MKIYKTINDEKDFRENYIIIHIPEHNIEIKVECPDGHDAWDMEVDYSVGDGWLEIEEK